MIRVGMICSAPLPPREGIGFYVWNLSRFLRRQGHSVQIITRGGPRPTDREEVDGIVVWRTPFLPLYPLHVHFHGLFVDRLLRRLEPELDLLHLHTPLVKGPHSTLPALVTVHTLLRFGSAAIPVRDALSVLIHLQTPFSVGLEKGLLERARAVTTVASSTLAELESYGVDGRTAAVCGNGVDVDTFSPGIAEELSGNPRILTAGRLVPGKGLDDLIECAGLVVARFPEVQFYIAGSGPFGANLQTAVARRGLGKTVVLLGHVSARPQMVGLYRRATLYVHPSRHEGLPTVLLEAMACGRPVVATAINGALDVIQDGQNGLLVPPRSPERMAEAVLRLLGDPELGRRLGAAARETVVERYSWEVIGRNYLDEYRRILGGVAG